MIAYVTQRGSAQKGIADGMYQDIGIGMSKQSQLMVKAYPAYPQLTSGYQTVHIESVTYPYQRPKMVLSPSPSNDRVNRIVWSRGLLWAVDTR